MTGGRVGSVLAPVLFETLLLRSSWTSEHMPYFLVTGIGCVLGAVVAKSLLTFELKNESLDEEEEGVEDPANAGTNAAKAASAALARGGRGSGCSARVA
mmetsp:Transcript_56503/g.111323  ORF Transcript_56503/g.111323 Transcript_56503/m.111323 type:complete len:99 (-) Transcript_56503:136-432(-)